jgi:lactate dehydrogenase-like 2-hydroxyacid dehydrogenase
MTAVRRSGRPEPGIELAGFVAELARGADHLVLAAHATAAIRGIVSAEVLSHAKRGLHLVNVAPA